MGTQIKIRTPKCVARRRSLLSLLRTSCLCSAIALPAAGASAQELIAPPQLPALEASSPTLAGPNELPALPGLPLPNAAPFPSTEAVATSALQAQCQVPGPTTSVKSAGHAALAGRALHLLGLRRVSPVSLNAVESAHQLPLPTASLPELPQLSDTASAPSAAAGVLIGVPKLQGPSSLNTTASLSPTANESDKNDETDSLLSIFSSDSNSVTPNTSDSSPSQEDSLISVAVPISSNESGDSLLAIDLPSEIHHSTLERKSPADAVLRGSSMQLSDTHDSTASRFHDNAQPSRSATPKSSPVAVVAAMNMSFSDSDETEAVEEGTEVAQPAPQERTTKAASTLASHFNLRDDSASDGLEDSTDLTSDSNLAEPGSLVENITAPAPLAKPDELPVTRSLKDVHESRSENSIAKSPAKPQGPIVQPTPAIAIAAANAPMKLVTDATAVQPASSSSAVVGNAPVTPGPSVASANTSVKLSTVSGGPTLPTSGSPGATSAGNSAVAVATSVTQSPLATSAAMPAPSFGRRVDLVAGEAQAILTDASILKFSVEHPEHCQIVKNGDRSASVIGIKPGKTRIALFYDQNKVEIREVVITGPVDLHPQRSQMAMEMTRAVAAMYPSASVEVVTDDEGLVVQGFAESENEAKKIIRMVRQSSLLPVVDRLSTHK